jgi:DNA-binding MarR family transcriptional regulator
MSPDMEKQSTQSKPLMEEIDTLIHSPARLKILAYLYVVDSADYVFLVHQTGLTWGNLATHLNKLEKAQYLEIIKTFKDKKPHSMVQMTKKGRSAFRDYKLTMQQVLDDLPD